MSNIGVQALLNEYRRAVAACSDMVRDWPLDKMSRSLPSAPKATCLVILKEAITTSYGNIAWIQKSAALPRMSPPEALATLDEAGVPVVNSLLRLMGPYAAETLRKLTDDQLSYRPVREYTLEQMLENTIVHMWLAVGRLEKIHTYHASQRKATE